MIEYILIVITILIIFGTLYYYNRKSYPQKPALIADSMTKTMVYARYQYTRTHVISGTGTEKETNNKGAYCGSYRCKRNKR